MIVFRIASEAFARDLTGEGAALYGGRWNSPGTKLLYTSGSVSLTILESLVHFRSDLVPVNLFLVTLDIPDANITEISASKIKAHWQTEPEYTQWIGDQFIANNNALVLKVPSVIVPGEYNFLLNPVYKEFRKVKLILAEPLELDKRLRSAV